MQIAAERLNAELLPNFPEASLFFPSTQELPDLPETENANVQRLGDDRRIVRLRGKDARMAVLLDSPFWYYARLARRDNVLILLIPDVTFQQEGERTQCECISEYRSGHRPSELPAVMFVLNSIPQVEVLEIHVPMTARVTRWHCKKYLTTNMPSSWNPPDLTPWLNAQ